jgi:hypothetical protein
MRTLVRMNDKICPGCGTPYEVIDFNFKDRSTGVRQVYCRDCSRRYARDHYQRNRDYYTAKARKRNQVDRQALHERVLAYLASHPCVDRGESDPAVLDFDHVDPEHKRMEVGRMITRGHSWAAIEREIMKCVVRCANDHRRRTAKQFNWYRSAPARPEGIEPPTPGSEDQCSIR